MLKKPKFILCLILFLALLLRAFHLTTNPPELHGDEIGNFATAKHILENGVDFSGNRAFYLADRLDLNPPIYGYSAYFISKVVPDVTLAIRITALIYGLLAILVLYLLTHQLIKNSLVALSSAFVLTIIPWHIHYSRIGWEPATFLFFLLLPTLLIINGISRNNKKLIILSAFLFGLSAYSYMATLFYSFLFLFIIFITNIFFFLKNIKTTLISLSVFIITLTPFLYLYITEPLLTSRSEQISTFRDGVNFDSLKLFSNNYISHFAPNFLFLKNFNELNYSSQTGQLYFWMLPLILIGFLYCLKTIKSKSSKLLIFWLLIYPLGGSLTNDGVPHPARTLIGAAIFSILAAIGIWQLKIFLSKKINFVYLDYFLFLTISVLTIFSLITFFKFYFNDYTVLSAPSWGYGKGEAFKKINSYAKSYKTICLDSIEYLGIDQFKYFYIKNNISNIYENLEDSNCYLTNSMLVIPASNISTFNSFDYKFIDRVYDISKKDVIYYFIVKK